MVIDPEDASSSGERLLLVSDRLTTHGVIVGMSGSGKTRLGIVLIEEVQAARIPVLALRSKSDISNHIMHLPSFSSSALESWVDPGEARRKGVSIPELA